MIFVTVGTQLAFDRLIVAVDSWAASHPDVEIFAQIGPMKDPPRHMPHAEFLSPIRADELVRSAELVVAHAGMGSILSALKYQRPILVVPRRAALREHRNDHQLATARWLSDRPGIFVAWTETEVGPILDRRSCLAAGPALGLVVDGPLVQRLSAYIHGGR